MTNDKGPMTNDKGPMIITVTFNSALDRLLFIDEFQPGTTIRPHKMVEAVGGKGFDVSVVLQALGVENLALGFVAGLNGQQLVKLLEGYSIRHDLDWVEGETRIAHVVVETIHHRHTHLIAAGLSVSNKAYQKFLKRYRAHLKKTTWVVTGGSVAPRMPVTVYRDLTELAHQAGVSMLLDSFGPPLLETLALSPAILKMNHQEFNQTFKIQTHSLDELATTARTIRQTHGLPALVITCGPEGILAITAKESYLATAPTQQAVNAAGAGDSVSAALLWRFLAGDDWPAALRWAAATGAAVTLTEKTAEYHWPDVERLVRNTTVQRL